MNFKCPHRRNRFVPACLLGLVFTGVVQSAAPRQIAFTSLGPIDAEIHLAEGDGSQPRPFLPHAGFDGNASFSRDGAWIVFTSEREGSFDIYRAHPDGTAIERLVDHPAYDDQAALSPDGKWLAFVSSRSGQADIWVLELATRAVRNLTNHLAGDFRPAWSPDGAWIAFSSDRESTKPKDVARFGTIHSTAVFVIRADGSELRRVTRANAFAGSPGWSQDGRQIIFHEAELAEVNKITTVRAGLHGTSQIGMIDLATNEHRTLTVGSGEKWSPRWLAHGRIAYVGGGPEGGVEFVGSAPGARGEFGCANWSADGRRMVFHREVGHGWPPVQPWHCSDPDFSLVRAGVFPAYSPSGDRLLSNDQRSAAGSKNILIMNPDGSERSVFFSHPEKSALGPVWSADGSQVAFTLGRVFQTMIGPAIADIAVVERDGSGLKILTDGKGNFGFPSWSPDGREIVYRSSTKGSMGLFILALETGEVRALTTGSSHDNFPAWSPKGDRIAFTGYRDGNYDLYTIKPDGTDMRRLTDDPGNDAHCAWSSDGEWIAFTSARGGFKDESILHPRHPQSYGEIYVMRADGSDVRALTDNPFEEGTVSFAPR